MVYQTTLKEFVKEIYKDLYLDCNIKNIYHFTPSICSLRSILTNNCLRLYDSTQQAPEELTHGQGITIRAIQEVIDTKKYDIDILRKAQSYFSNSHSNKSDLKVYTSSFCKCYKDEKMWNNYAFNGNGYCIEFDIGSDSRRLYFDGYYCNQQYHCFRLYRVSYKPCEEKIIWQKKLISSYFDKLYDLSKTKNRDSLFLTHFIAYLSIALAIYKPCYYDYENEVRLVLTHKTAIGNKFQFKEDGKTRRTFIETNGVGKDYFLPPIRRILVKDNMPDQKIEKLKEIIATLAETGRAQDSNDLTDWNNEKDSEMLKGIKVEKFKF